MKPYHNKESQMAHDEGYALGVVTAKRQAVDVLCDVMRRNQETARSESFRAVHDFLFAAIREICE